MTGLQAIGLFCEDIRDEASGQKTLIGIQPDNFFVPSVPGLIPKVGVYIRLHVPADYEPKNDLHVFMLSPNGEENELSRVDKAFLEDSIKDAIRENNPIAGMIISAVMTPFGVNEFGRFSLVLDADEGRIHLGGLNILQLPTLQTPE